MTLGWPDQASKKDTGKWSRGPNEWVCSSLQLHSVILDPFRLWALDKMVDLVLKCKILSKTAQSVVRDIRLSIDAMVGRES